MEHLEALKDGPGGTLYDLRETVSGVSDRLENLAGTVERVMILADRTARVQALVSRQARRRKTAGENARRSFLERERNLSILSEDASRTERALAEAETAADRVREEHAAATAAAEASGAAAADSDQRLSELRATLASGESRREALSRRLQRSANALEGGAGNAEAFAARAARTATRLVTTVRLRRSALRRLRGETAEAHRRVSAERTTLSRRTVDLAGKLATARAQAERLAEEVSRAESAAAEAGEEIQAEWGATLQAARQEAEKHEESTDGERQTLARKLKRFGDVNLLALSQEEGLRERHQFVSAQRADAEAAANELNRIIQSVDREIESRFAETFRRVRDAFGEMVPRMMEGSSGVLDLSEDGVEIGLRLGRKGWRPLRVLSGGERALLALSFLFSIFLSRPGGDSGAFCVLDEAEAALDDLNLARFLTVVDSHRANGQYLLVTHQKRTMAAADVLYGVIQDTSGATTVVSKRLQGE
jgi:chromosome segregation protein